MKKRFAVLLSMGLILLSSMVCLAESQNTYMVSRFPNIYGDAGETITYDVSLTNRFDTGQLIELEVVNMPEGWENRLTVSGKQVRYVYLEPSESVDAKITVDIPITTQEDIYTFDLKAVTENSTDTLSLTTEVKEIPYKENQMTVDYPDLTGDAKTSFSYRINLINNGLEDTSYSLDAIIPDGWQVSFVPSGSSDKVASVVVEAGTTQTVTLNVKSPEFAEEGTYDIHVTADSVTESLSQDLSVKITGTYELNLTTPTGKLSDELVAGEEKQVKLVVENTGGSDLENIQLSSWEPNGWETRFEDKSIDVLAPGESREIIAYVKADDSAISGDYVMSITASTSEVSEDIEFRMTVVTSKLWGGVGLGIIAAMALVMGMIMKKYGRR